MIKIESRPNSPRWITGFFYSGPYLENPNRLQDGLAAIQVLGTYEFAARELDRQLNESILNVK